MKHFRFPLSFVPGSDVEALIERLEKNHAAQLAATQEALETIERRFSALEEQVAEMPKPESEKPREAKSGGWKAPSLRKRQYEAANRKVVSK